MEIDKTDKIFTPTIEWISSRYDELNAWLFSGKLMSCSFDIYTSGHGAENTLGHFVINGHGVKYDKTTRRMFRIGFYDNKITYINSENFVDYLKPAIGLNGNYKRTELMWLNTLVHEMCHYYTYMNGYIPKQAHGTEFKRIASIVEQKSNGLFKIQRLCEVENLGELNPEIIKKRSNR